ncbi:GntR family transcriptional regulator [Lederbergia galactosidilytica]|uniref:GntR family transcriptional regulator n=1 Tax=Lederbergia galactosidilytica TaxID=217031 RepID=A0A177ZVP1_9BACI|nr:GntR family transcriptional regulator [Lederbergia galactosidilytica]KRG09338.1 GntR family transcriptional regulator [Virgibacillus soli]MBP1913438.1 GntR family transcriptional regulator of arabinose operon [Lederbergia galactosidilytica]OAK71390.1 GntR family transcriptional regulator [Lederbergia galactosidilytica]
MGQPAKYIIVINKIKEWIETGEVKPGDKIYSENELSKMFQVSRHTIRQAIGELVHEGLLYREQGAGTFIAKPAKTLSPTIAKPTISGKNIGIITTYISDYIFPAIIRGMESYLTSKGYSLFISSTNNEVEKERQCLEAMLDRNVDGLIIEPTKSSGYNPNIPYYLELEQRNIPYLMINQYYSQLNPPYILMDDEKGGLLATEHLIELGHDKIIGIFKTDDLQGIYRMKGFINAFRNHRIPFQNETVISYTTEELPNVLQEKIEKLLADPEQTPTGIVCYNDEIALKIIHILKGKGYRVPDDISIIGYDNSALAEASEIKITSINHPKVQLGIDAAKWIVEAIEQPDTFEKPNVTYEPELVIRESTRSLRTRN